MQPKSGFLPEADAGDPNSGKPDGANEAGQPVSRPLSRPSPTANLAGIWKGEPLDREVRGLHVHPNVKVNVVCYAFGISAAAKYMLDAIYIGIIVGGMMSLMIYAAGCEKL